MTSKNVLILNTSRHSYLSDLIKQFITRRKSLGLTQEDVDYMMGNSEGLCSKWECGIRSPTAFNLYCWAEALNSKVLLING